jgi:hypothetical protein
LNKPISIRLIILLAAVVYCVPANHEAILRGAPLRILGGTLLIAFIAVAIAVDRPARFRGTWLAALAAIAVLRWASGALAPNLGWTASYMASTDASQAVERSTEVSLSSGTRVDRAIDFHGADFPVHFFNDIRRFNFYRPTDTARDTMPFSVSWSGVLLERPALAEGLILVTNGPATLQVGDSTAIEAPLTDVARKYEVPLASLQRGAPIRLTYARPFEVYPTTRLLWVDSHGGQWPVGVPDIAASPSDASSSSLATVMQWLGTATSLALLVLVAGAVTVAHGSPRDTSSATVSAAQPVRLRHRASSPGSPRDGGPSVPGAGEVTPACSGWERAFLAIVLLWAAIEPISSWLPFDQETILLSGGNDWLAYESFARDIQLNGLLMNNGRPPGTGDAYYYQPAYAYALAALHRLLGESLGPILWWQHASLGLVAAFVYGLARQLAGPIAAVLAALFVMAFRSLELFGVSGLLLSENLLFLVLPAMLWLFVRAYQQPTLVRFAWAGAALGLAGLTRSTPLLILPFALLAIVLAGGRTFGWRKTALTAALFLATCFGIVGLATVRNAIVSGTPTLITTSAGANLIEAHRPTDKVDMKGIDQNPVYERLGLDRQTREVLEFMRQDPQGYLATLWPTAAYAIGYVEPILSGRGVEWPLITVFVAYLAITLVVPAVRRNGAWLVHAFVLTHWLQTALFFSHQYGFRLPLPMYLPMLAIIAVGIAWIARTASSRILGIKSTIIRPRMAYAGIVVLVLWSGSLTAFAWSNTIEAAPTRLYTLEGDAAAIATAVRSLPDEDRPNWAYGSGNDKRTREIAYLRGLAFPLIKWVDIDQGMVFPPVGTTAIFGTTDERPPGRFFECVSSGPRLFGAALYRLESPRGSACVDLTRPAGVEFENISRVIGASAPPSIRAGERFTGLAAWETIERPRARYRPVLEIVGPDNQVLASAESNPYGTDNWSPGEVITSIHELSVDPHVPPGEYTLALSFGGGSPRPSLADPSALLFRAPLGPITVEPPSQPLQPAQLGISLRSPWSVGSLNLVGASSSPGPFRPGDPLDLKLAWQAAQASPAAVDLLLELVGPTRSALIPHLTPLDGRWPLERWRRGDSVADHRTIVLPNDLPGGTYQLRIRDLARAESTTEIGTVAVEPRERRVQPPSVRAASQDVLGSAFRLVGYDLRNRRPDPGDTVELGLTWQAVASSSARYTVVISMVDSQTNRVAVRRETEPADGARPTTGWSNGEYVVDNHRVRTSRDLPSGRYRVRVDLVERDSGRYLLSANGSAGIVLPPEVVVE